MNDDTRGRLAGIGGADWDGTPQDAARIARAAAQALGEPRAAGALLLWACGAADHGDDGGIRGRGGTDPGPA